MRTFLDSEQLQFTRDGQTLVVVEPDTLVLVALDGDRRQRIEISGIRSAAVVSDQVWVADHTGALLRLTCDGRSLGRHVPSSAGRIVAASIGVPAALWHGQTSSLLIDDLGTLSCVDVGSTDQVIPIAGRKFGKFTGSRLVLPSGATCTLPSGARISGGATVFDGAALAVVAETQHAREIKLVSLTSATVSQSIAIPHGAIRIAARRGIVIVQHARRSLTLIDLKFARVVGAITAEADIEDFAIDPDAKRVAMRAPDGSVAVTVLTPSASPKHEPIEPSPPPTVRAVETEIAPIPARTPPRRPAISVAAFEPRPLDPVSDLATIRAALDREMRVVSARTLLAISKAWDTRRLAFGNEGHHPFEHEVAGLVGRNGGFAIEYVTAAREALAAIEEHSPEDSSSALVARELGLSDAALDMLLTIAAPTIDGEIAQLYRILGNEIGRPLVDELVLQQVLAERLSAHEIAAELHPRAPLVRKGIVTVEASRRRPFAALEIHPVIVSRLRGEAPELGYGRLRGPHCDLDSIDLAPSVLADAITTVARAVAPARIVVRGRPGSGRRELLAIFASHAHRKICVIDAAVLPHDRDRFEYALATSLQAAQLSGAVPVIDNLDVVVFDQQTGIDIAREILPSHPGAVALTGSSESTALASLGTSVIDLPALTETERLGVWERTLERAGHWLRGPELIASRYRIGPGTIHRAVASLEASTEPCDDRVELALRSARDVRLGDHARRVTRTATWADLVVPSDIMDSLRELVGRVRHRRTVYEDWGMGRTMLTSRGLTALFAGQPGTGKTLVAGVIARELGLDLYQVDLSKVMSKWIGETERNLARLFDAAEDGQMILLFDEADSLFARRTEVRSSNDRYANLEVNYLLQRLDSFEGIAILTTNSGGSIDPAFKRRLSFSLSFPFPDEDTRAELWRTHLPAELPRSGELVFDGLARKYQLSGGYIRNACLRAAFLAAQEETPLHQHHLERAVALEFAELGKLSTTGAIS
jgi:ATPase family associated with various cellular activities (AAA)